MEYIVYKENDKGNFKQKFKSYSREDTIEYLHKTENKTAIMMACGEFVRNIVHIFIPNRIVNRTDVLDISTKCTTFEDKKVEDILP